jgi:hypothetical protein
MSPLDLSGSSERLLARRQFIATAGVGGALLLAPGLTRRATAARRRVPPRDTLVVRWNEALLQGVRGSGLGPPMVARALAIAHTCVYDAWAAYDDRAVGTRLGGLLRRPPAERTRVNVEQAISFAAYHAAAELFPASVSSVFDPLMHTLCYDERDLSTDTSRPTGVGNVAAQAVLDFRYRDGANQLGEEPGGLPGVAYSDYTGYVPANDPMDVRVPFDPTTVHDPNFWQPLRYVDTSGNLVTQSFVGAQWQHVTAFGLSPSSGLRSPSGPANYGSADYLAQARALLELSAGLTDEDKVIAEYWADGPHSAQPPGHWNLIAQLVSRRDDHGADPHGLERDVKLFFALTNALFDASCCTWDNKRAFNSVRPITTIRYLFRGQRVLAWAGPYHGTKMIDGASWLPYQPMSFPTPPFPEYSSGHSTFSAASAEILKRFTRSDRFGASATLSAGSSKVEPGAVPATDLTLHWTTFSDAADQAGISRRYGGIHFEQGDLDGRTTGRIAAQLTWQKARQYWEGASQ